MAATSHLNGRQQREPFPEKAQTKAPARLPGDLFVMATLIGISRAFFGPGKTGPVAQTLSGLQDTFTSSGRGREASTSYFVTQVDRKTAQFEFSAGL